MAARVMASVADINWHDLRHTFASRLLRKTRNPAWVQKALGHASIKHDDAPLRPRDE